MVATPPVHSAAMAEPSIILAIALVSLAGSSCAVVASFLGYLNLRNYIRNILLAQKK